MNSKAAFLLMLFAVVVASFLHERKLSAKDSGMDRLANGLAGIRSHIKSTSHILLENKTPKGELSFMARYQLTSAIIDMRGSADTILSIADKNDLTPAGSTRELLWSNSDSSYRYTLTRHP